nr:hypothetical protein [Candidatus Enterovibrio escacola]
MGGTPNFLRCQRKKPYHISVNKVMTLVIAFHKSGYRDFKTYYIHFIYRYLTNEFPELFSYTQMRKLMQGVLVSLDSYLTHRQRLPSLIHPSYKLITTYVFSDIKCLKVQRSEEKEL